MKKFKILFFFLFILLLFIFASKFNNYIDEHKFVKIFVFVVILTYFLVSFFSNKKIQKILNILLFYFIICTYLLNLLLATPYYFNSDKYRTKIEYKRLGITFDSRSSLEYITDNKSEKIFPLISPREIMKKEENLILSNISNAKYIQCNEFGFWKKIKTDKYGFNNSTVSNNYDVLISGDSFAHGFCVDKDKEVHNLLKRDGINAYSVGIAGNGPLLTLATIIEIDKKIQFNNIYWLFYRNDFYDLIWESKNKQLTKYLEKKFEGLNYFNKLDNKDKLQELFISKNINQKKDFSLKESFFELKFLNFYFKKIFGNTIERKINENLIKKIFYTFDYRFKKKNKSIIYIPDQSCFVKSRNCDEEIKILQNALDQINVKVIDLREYMNNKNYKIYYALGLEGKHFSETGYKVISEVIYDNLTKD